MGNPLRPGVILRQKQRNIVAPSGTVRWDSGLLVRIVHQETFKARVQVLERNGHPVVGDEYMSIWLCYLRDPDLWERLEEPRG